MKLSENKYKYWGHIHEYINGEPLDVFKHCIAPKGDGWFKVRKGYVQTFRVSKKVNGEFIGLSDTFNTFNEAWDFLEQFEEGII